MRKRQRVLKRGSKEYIVLVADPATGLLKYTKDEFLKCWYSTKSEGMEEGTALLLEPTPDFYRQEDEEKHKLSFSWLLGYIRPYSESISSNLCWECLQRA